MSSLSIAGATMSIIALSTVFFEQDSAGTASSALNLVYYLGVGCIGLIGGWLLQKWSASFIGIWASLISAFFLFLLASMNTVPVSIGLVLTFFIFLLNGIEHPNNIRFLNDCLDPSEKPAFFSFSESTTAFFQITTPILTALIITRIGTKTCFMLDGITYLLSAIPWIFVKNQKKYNKHPCDLFKGFRTIFKYPKLKKLTFFRLLNNMAFVSCTTSIPIVISILAKTDEAYYVFNITTLNTLTSVGFISAGLIGASVLKSFKGLPILVHLASYSGFIACLLLFTASKTLLPFSALILGIGTYCFRISGMTLGQSFTPPDLLGPVIIAGDTIVRIWSFFISLVTIILFKAQESIELPFALFFVLIMLLPSLALISPKLILNESRTDQTI